jgi:hypothetical protein
MPFRVARLATDALEEIRRPNGNALKGIGTRPGSPQLDGVNQRNYLWRSECARDTFTTIQQSTTVGVR